MFRVCYCWLVQRVLASAIIVVAEAVFTCPVSRIICFSTVSDR